MGGTGRGQGGLGEGSWGSHPFRRMMMMMMLMLWGGHTRDAAGWGQHWRTRVPRSHTRALV